MYSKFARFYEENAIYINAMLDSRCLKLVVWNSENFKSIDLYEHELEFRIRYLE